MLSLKDLIELGVGVNLSKENPHIEIDGEITPLYYDNTYFYLKYDKGNVNSRLKYKEFKFQKNDIGQKFENLNLIK